MSFETNSMLGINGYGKELTKEEIDKKVHRHFVGGLWHEIGQLQFNFLINQSLKPFHKLLDIGCGCLRGGLHFIKYLDEGNYYGLDINASLIQAGKLEVKEAGLEYKYPKTLVDSKFRIERFGIKFDFMISVSLFTHLPINIIIRCLSEVKKHLKPGGVYFSSIFESPESAHLDALTHPSGITTNCDSDPFHYSFKEMLWMADIVGLKLNRIGDWEHPRDHKMVAFLQAEGN